jgi:hypothetical protein
MKEIKMTVNGRVETFRVIYQCDQYIFCECDKHPALRGFYTTEFVASNKSE